MIISPVSMQRSCMMAPDRPIVSRRAYCHNEQVRNRVKPGLVISYGCNQPARRNQSDTSYISRKPFCKNQVTHIASLACRTTRFGGVAEHSSGSQLRSARREFIMPTLRNCRSASCIDIFGSFGTRKKRLTALLDLDIPISGRHEEEL